MKYILLLILNLCILSGCSNKVYVIKKTCEPVIDKITEIEECEKFNL